MIRLTAKYPRVAVTTGGVAPGGESHQVVTATLRGERGERPVPPWMPLVIDGLHFRRASASA